MECNLNNTFVIRTDDEHFEEILIKFLSEHCDSNFVNAAYYHLNAKGAKKVMDIVQG